MGKSYKYFSKDDTLSHFSGDEDILEVLIKDFLESADELLNEIKRSFSSPRFEDLEISAHTLKGILKNFFCSELVERAYILEQMGKNQESSGSDLAYQSLSEGVKTLCTELDDFSRELASS